MGTKLQEIRNKLEFEILKGKFNKLLTQNPSGFKDGLLDCLITNGVVDDTQVIFKENINEEPEPDRQDQQQEYRVDKQTIENWKQPLLDIPTNTTTIIIDGRKQKIDLLKIAKWTFEKETTQLKNYRRGIDKIKEMVSKLDYQFVRLTEERILETAASIYWNITVYFDRRENKNFKNKETKLVYQILAIFYAILYVSDQKITDNSELLGELFKMNEINPVVYKSYFNVFKEIFKKSFIKDILETKEEPIEIDKSEFNKELIEKIINTLEENNVLPNNIYTFAAIAFYIEQLKSSKITLTDISKKLKLTNLNKLNKTYSITANYINKNAKIKKQIKRKI